MINHVASGDWMCDRVGVGVEGDISYLQLVDEHGDGVELIVRIRRVSHGERVGRRGTLVEGSKQQCQGSGMMAEGEREESLIACRVM